MAALPIARTIARAAAALVLLSASSASSQSSVLPGAFLQINWCNTSDPLQQFAVTSTAVSTTDGSLCATMSSPWPAALTMQTCDASDPTQWWSFNTTVPLGFASPGSISNCTLWNTQGGPGYERPLSTVGTYACSLPTPFDSVFAPGVPAPGLLAATMTEPGNHTFSDLCVQAVNPPPPPIGTPQQIAWQTSEMACFVHWNMATAAGTQGCDCNSAPPNVSTWNPTALDTDAWITAGVAMGCSRFIYVAKHGCGFCTWPSNAMIQGERYPYSVAFAPNTTDVVSAFVTSAKKAGVGFGFYYSVGSNAKCHACSGTVYSNPQPGQLNVTQDEFNNLVIQQLIELWSAFGPLAEVW